MSIFLLAGLVSWSIVMLLFAHERQIRRYGYSDGSVVIYVRGLYSLRINPGLYHKLSTIATVFIASIFILVAIYQASVTQPEGKLYEWYELLTGRRFAQGILGFVFGTLLASWMVQLYRAGNSEKMSIAQKVEGLALLGLLIVGTTSITAEEVLRGFKVGTDGVSLQVAATEVSGSRSKSVLTPPPDGGAMSAKLGGQWGITALISLPDFIARDDNSIVVDGGQSDPLQLASATTYSSTIGNLVICLKTLATATGDDVYLRDMIGRAKPHIRELLFEGFALRTKPDNAELEKSIAATSGQLAYELLNVETAISGQAKRLSPGLSQLADAAKAGSRRDSRSDLRCNFSSEPAVIKIKRYTDSIAPKHFERRPYLAVIYASVLQLENQELAAIDALNDWMLIDREARKDGGNKTFTELKNENKTAYWQKIRIYNSIFTVFETLFRRESDQPQLVRDFQLSFIKDYINIMSEDSQFLKEYNDTLLKEKLNMSSGKFAKDIPPTGICRSKDIQTTIRIYLLFNAKTIFARRAADHPELIERFLPLATAYMDEIVDADISCFSVFQDVQTLRAESYLVYARLYAARALARKDIDSESYKVRTINDLTLVENALNVAIGVVDKAAIDSEQDYNLDVIRLSNIRETRYAIQLLNDLRLFRNITKENIERLR